MLDKGLYNIINAIRALWLVVAHDLPENIHTNDVTGSLFSLFCPTWRAILKVFARLFRIKQVKASKIDYQELFTSKEEKKKQRQNVAFVSWNMLKMAQIFEQSSVTRPFCHFSFSVHCRKRIDSMLPCVCSIIDHRGRQKGDECISDTIACGSCTTFFVLTTFWLHLWSITEQTYGNMESMC